MDFLFDYFSFTFLACFGVVLMSISKNPNSKLNFFGRTRLFWLGVALICFSYVWFFSIKNRNVQTIVEGAQLFFVFALSAAIVIYLSKFFVRIKNGS
jgi:ABC-type Fe3+-siderophore transport system permease subunit